jgi:hypothetical protein
MAYLNCCECGITFSVPDQWCTHRRDDRRIFWCPNGHEQSFTTSISEQLRRERDQLKQELARVEDEKREALAAKEQEINRIKKRAAAGTCPCCQRTFSNMAVHMKHQHPEFVADSRAKVIPISNKKRQLGS